MISSHEEYRHKRARLLRDVIDRGLVGKTLVQAEIIQSLPEEAYRSGGLETIFGFYEAVNLGPDSMKSHLLNLYRTDEQGLTKMLKKVEDLLGERFVGRYNELKHYLDSNK